MTTYVPTGGQTIFPRINYLKNYEARAAQRDINGRIYDEPVVPSTIGNVTFTLDGNSFNPAVSTQLDLGSEHTIVAAIDGDANPAYTWTITAGTGTLSSTNATALYTPLSLGSSTVNLVLDGRGITDAPFNQDILFEGILNAALNLDFAGTLSLDDSVSGNNLVTFTRASTGTYFDASGIVQTAAADTPRFDHDPETGESLGLLIEEARTNLVQYSEDFSQTSQWAPVAASFNLDSAAVAPDGSTGTYKVVEAATTGSHYARCSPSNQCIAGTTYTYSMFCKAAERTQIMIHFDQEGNNTYFDLSSGEIVSGTIGTIKSVGNGWYHCSITLNPANNTEPKFYIAVNGSISFSGDGVSGLYVWGAQLEAATFPTSYIPTAGATATRAVDLASITGTNFSSWYNTAESTWYIEGDQLGLNANGDQASLQSMFADRYANIAAQRRTAKSWRGRQGTTEVVPTFTTPNTPKGSTVKVTYAIDGTNAKMGVEGVLSATGTLAAYPQTTELSLGQDSASGSPWVGHIKHLSYYNTRLADQLLIDLTS